jgi:ABC-2 type transport system permease protein
VTATFAAYRSSKELFYNLTLRELRSKYKRSFLGWAWSTVTPLAITVVYTLVFKYFLKSSVPPAEPSGLNVFALYLLSAMLPWNFFQSSVTACIGSLVGNSNLIKKTYFPRELLPTASVASNMVSHAIEMGLLLTAMLSFGNWRALEFLPFTIFLMLVMAVFALGLGLTLSVLNVYFRDIQHFVSILFLMWFFMTPIVYSIDRLGHRAQMILKINPITDAALCFRDSLYNGTHPGWLELGYFVVCAVAALLIGRVVFNRFEGGLAEEL